MVNLTYRRVVGLAVQNKWEHPYNASKVDQI